MYKFFSVIVSRERHDNAFLPLRFINPGLFEVLMMSLLSVTMAFILQEDLLIYKVTGECNCRDAETGERIPEPIKSCKWTSIPPCFTV
jgi:hypothetical protein